MQALRLRLTLLYAGVLALATGILLALSWWVLDRHLTATLPAGYADAVAGQVAWQFLVAAVGLVMVAAGAGWWFAGPLLDRVEQSVERQRRFVANASHELRTPLTVIRTEIDVTLADERATTEDLRAMGRVVLEAVDRSDALLEGLLTLAAASQAPPGDTPVELAAMARGSVAAIAPAASAAHVRFDLAAETAWVRGEPALIERLLANLLENVVRHAPHGNASVRIRDGATIEVANGGAVIAPDVVARLGQPFQRLDRHSGAQGSGLGLSIARAIAETHGGDFAIDAPPTGGLSVRVTLPGIEPVDAARVSSPAFTRA
ncbi:MAG TPA: HAMP domain-containing sensor histidine kinase [Solirubrobacteraceae bacterium]|nr:HAMP domain-containing sensor histidine kinase [Solirubrobacteraceae bacterium]